MSGRPGAEDRTIATHYASIGFPAQSLEALEEQVLLAVASARHVAAGPGMDFAVWEDTSGAALWVQVTEGAVVGAHPFYAPAQSHMARIEAAEPEPESPMQGQGAMDGQARLYVRPDEAVLLPVDIVNWPLVASALRPQSVVPLRLCAFAEAMEAWADPEEYQAGHPETRHQGLRWMVPTGLYPTEKGGTGRATASITGIVQAVEIRVNSLTGASFLWMRLETAGATLDVVAPPDAAGSVPGGVVRGHFWLAGLVEPDVPDSQFHFAAGGDREQNFQKKKRL